MGDDRGKGENTWDVYQDANEDDNFKKIIRTSGRGRRRPRTKNSVVGIGTTEGAGKSTSNDEPLWRLL